jgi:hypothetical protein
MTRDTTDASSIETGGSKPAVVELSDGTTIDVAHHIIPSDKPVVHVYLEARDGGIDATIPLANVQVIARSDKVRDDEDVEWQTVTFGSGDPPVFEDDDEDGERLVTDGGRDVEACKRDGCTNDVDMQGLGLESVCSPYCLREERRDAAGHTDELDDYCTYDLRAGTHGGLR